MKEPKFSQIVEIFSAAENILRKIQLLPQLTEKYEIILPSQYDASRNGGYFAIYQKSDHIEVGELIQIGKIGTISASLDEKYGTKSQKYKEFAEAVCQFIIQQSDTLTSDETGFGRAGGIRVNDLVFGFDGRTELENELLVVATGYSFQHSLPLAERTIRQSLEKLHAKNPFLSEDILNLVLNPFRDI